MIKRPILFEDTTGAVTADTFRGNGLGVLIDAISCEVTEELDGVFELNMRYPQSGLHFSELKTRRIIYAKASDELGWQPFRIVKIGRSLKGICTVYAQHYSYDLNGVTVSPFTAEHVEDALDAIKANSVPENPFTFSTNKNTEGEMEITVPRSVRNAIVGEEGSLLATYKGDLVFDHSTVTLLGTRGSDRGFRILYGKNMTGLDQTEDVQKLYTAIYPYFYSPPSEAIGEDMEGSPEIYIELDEKTVQAEGDFSYSRVKVVDFSDNEEMMALVQSEDADEDQKKSKLKMLAREYLKDNDIGVHRMAVTATFERLKNSAEAVGKRFEDIKVQLGDTVSVLYPKLGTDVKARIVRMVFDSLADRVKKVEIGEVKTRITDSFSSLESKVREHETRLGETQKAVARLNVFTDDDVATIRGMTEWKDETTDAIATLDATSKQNSASIGLMVEVTEDENGETVTKGKGKFFIEAINGESKAQISADRINLVGYLTVSDVDGTSGETIIDGSTIISGTIQAAKINVTDLNAFDATIGGWTIAKDRIYKATSGSASEMDSPCGMYSGSDLDGYYWDSLVTEGGKSPIRFYAGGSPVDKTCNFAVLEDGSVYLGAAKMVSTGGVEGYNVSETLIEKGRLSLKISKIDTNRGALEACKITFDGRPTTLTPEQADMYVDGVLSFKYNSTMMDTERGKFYAVPCVCSETYMMLDAGIGGNLNGYWHYGAVGPAYEIMTAHRLKRALESLRYNDSDTITVEILKNILNSLPKGAS